MHFENLIEQVNKGLTGLSFPQNWCQGRTAFGGLSAAMLYRAMANQISDARKVLSLSTNFVGPLYAEIPFNIEVTVLRQGKNASQIQASIIQNDEVKVISLGSFAVDRESNVTINNQITTKLSQPNERNIMPYIEGITPEFFQHMAFDIHKGDMPFSNSKNHELAGWMKLKEQPESMTIELLIALTDAWPPAQLQMFTQPAPASSMSWYLEFVPTKTFTKSLWLGFEAFTHFSAQGYACEEANIYTSQGDLVAMSRQTVALFN